MIVDIQLIVEIENFFTLTNTSNICSLNRISKSSSINFINNFIDLNKKL